MSRSRFLALLILFVLIGGLPRPSLAQPTSVPWGDKTSPFGVVGNLAVSVRRDEHAAAVALMQEAGVQWNREEISWERLQPQENGVFLWSGNPEGFNDFDSAISAQAKARINVLGLLAYNPAWFKSKNPALDAWIGDWYDYVYAVVSRYGKQRNQIKHWEIWNEPNLRMYGYENGLYTIENYVSLLQTAQRAIRAADPQAKVVLGGVTAVWSDPPSHNYDILTYLQMLGDAGGWNTFDILAVHPYRPGAPEDAFWRRDRFVDFEGELADLEALMGRYGVKPLWFTEISWSSFDGYEGRTEQEQAWLISRLYALTLAHPAVEKIFWYNLRNTSVSFTPYDAAARDPQHPEFNFGLMQRTYPLVTATPDLRKPAFRAFRTMTDLLAPLRLAAVIADGKRPDMRRVFWYRWSRADQHVEIIWRMPDATTTAVSLNCDCREVRVRRWDGRLLRIIQTGDGNLVLRLPQAGEPVFLEYGPGLTDLNGLFFAETNHGLSGRFLRYWQANGGLAQFGYPITDVLIEPDPITGMARQVQYFERNRFEYFPEFANTRFEVQLGLLGVDLLKQQGINWQTLPIRPTTPLGCRRFPETQRTLCPPFRAYWETYGGLAMYGLPVSEAVIENGRLVQYFERNRFEEHPEFRGTRYEVLLGLLGRELFSTWGNGP